MICYPGGTPTTAPAPDDDDDEEDDEPEQKRHITRILNRMDQWSQRVSGLELQLMLKQASSSVCHGFVFVKYMSAFTWFRA